MTSEPPSDRVRSGAVWLDGELVDRTTARISVFDHGFTVGDGVFETMKVVTRDAREPVAFALTRHLERLRRSAAILRLPVAISDDELRRVIAEVIAANPGSGRIRVTITGGPGPAGSGRGDADPTVLVVAGPPNEPVTAASVVTVPWRRNEHGALAGAKTTSYAENVVALQHAVDHGASEAIFANIAGHLCEGTGSNVFVVVGDRVLTPPLSSGCLAGVTRDLVIEVSPVDQTDVALAVLVDADEAFLTSSTRDVQPIASVDGRLLPRCGGPLTTAAADALARLVASDPDP